MKYNYCNRIIAHTYNRTNRTPHSGFALHCCRDKTIKNHLRINVENNRKV